MIAQSDLAKGEGRAGVGKPSIEIAGDVKWFETQEVIPGEKKRIFDLKQETTKY